MLWTVPPRVGCFWSSQSTCILILERLVCCPYSLDKAGPVVLKLPAGHPKPSLPWFSSRRSRANETWCQRQVGKCLQTPCVSVESVLCISVTRQYGPLIGWHVACLLIENARTDCLLLAKLFTFLVALDCNCIFAWFKDQLAAYLQCRRQCSKQCFSPLYCIQQAKWWLTMGNPMYQNLKLLLVANYFSADVERLQVSGTSEWVLGLFLQKHAWSLRGLVVQSRGQPGQLPSQDFGLWLPWMTRHSEAMSPKSEITEEWSDHRS